MERQLEPSEAVDDYMGAVGEMDPSMGAEHHQHPNLLRFFSPKLMEMFFLFHKQSSDH